MRFLVCFLFNFIKERVYGCPTVRNDIPKYSRRSVADMQNYGDDCNADDLLRPKKYYSLGISDSDFSKPRSREYIYDMFMKSNIFELNETLFNEMFSSVQNTFGMVSVENFRDEYNKRNVKNCQ